MSHLTHSEEELYNKLCHVLNNYVETKDGIYTFPDGGKWNCKKAKDEDGVS